MIVPVADFRIASPGATHVLCRLMRSLVQKSIVGSWRSRLLLLICSSVGCVLPKVGSLDESATKVSSMGMPLEDAAASKAKSDSLDAETRSDTISDAGDAMQSSADDHVAVSGPGSEAHGDEGAAGVGGTAANAQMIVTAGTTADAGGVVARTMMDGGSVSNTADGSAGGATAAQPAPQPNAHCGRTGDTACLGSYQILTCDGQTWSTPQTCVGGGDCFPDASVNGAACISAIKECEGVSSGTPVCTVTATLYVCEGGGLGTFATQCSDPNPNCSSGRCTCLGTKCGEQCLHLDSDWHNCGKCGHDCGNAGCFNGICGTTNSN